MAKHFRGFEHPILIATLVGLLALSASLAHAQPSTRARFPQAIATRALARGTVLSASDFVVRDTTLRGVVDTTEVAEGWVTRRLIGAGEVLREPAVERPHAVVANQPVQLEWRDGNVTLTLRGIATRNAAIGERVAIRTDSGRRLDATVVAPGRVRFN